MMYRRDIQFHVLKTDIRTARVLVKYVSTPVLFERWRLPSTEWVFWIFPAPRAYRDQSPTCYALEVIQQDGRNCARFLRDFQSGQDLLNFLYVTSTTLVESPSRP